MVYFQTISFSISIGLPHNAHTRMESMYEYEWSIGNKKKVIGNRHLLNFSKNLVLYVTLFSLISKNKIKKTYSKSSCSFSLRMLAIFLKKGRNGVIVIKKLYIYQGTALQI